MVRHTRSHRHGPLPFLEQTTQKSETGLRLQQGQTRILLLLVSIVRWSMPGRGRYSGEKTRTTNKKTHTHTGPPPAGTSNTQPRANRPNHPPTDPPAREPTHPPIHPPANAPTHYCSLCPSTAARKITLYLNPCNCCHQNYFIINPIRNSNYLLNTQTHKKQLCKLDSKPRFCARGSSAVPSSYE